MNMPRGREKKVMGSFSNSMDEFKKQVLKGDIIVVIRIIVIRLKDIYEH